MLNNTELVVGTLHFTLIFAYTNCIVLTEELFLSGVLRSVKINYRITTSQQNNAENFLLSYHYIASRVSNG